MLVNGWHADIRGLVTARYAFRPEELPQTIDARRLTGDRQVVHNETHGISSTLTLLLGPRVQRFDHRPQSNTYCSDEYADVTTP